MAISTDNSAQASSSGSVNSLTISSYVNGGNFIAVLFGENTGSPSQTSVTFGAQTFTALTSAQGFAKAYILPNANTATANIVLTRSSTSTATIRATVVSYKITNTTQPDNQGTHTASSTNNDSFSITPVVTGCWAIVFASNDGGATTTAGTGLTLRQANTGDPSFAILDSNGTVTAGSAYSMSVNAGGTVNMGETFITLAPVATANTNHFLSSLGVGN